MSTILSFMSGRQLTDADGDPLPGAKLRHYRANTNTPLTVYTNQDGNAITHAHAVPVVCDAGGFVPIIYIDDTSDWKVVTTDQNDIAQPQHSYDLLPGAVSAANAETYTKTLLEWTVANAAGSPYTLTAADAGKAYEVNTTAGNVTINLPSAASVGNGKGFIFKKVASANSMIIDPSGSETIDDSSTSITITTIYAVLGIFSNGAEWYRVNGYRDINVVLGLLPLPTVQRFASGSGTYTPTAGTRFIRVRMIAGGGGGGATTTNAGTGGTGSTFGGWGAGAGVGGQPGGGTVTAGGSGGANGTGTLLHRVSGGEGSTFIFVTGSTGGFGGNGVFGGAAASAAGSTAGGNGAANSGAGGGGGAGVGNAGGSGGGAGEYVEFLMTAAQIGASQGYAVGGGGAGGAAGSRAGGNGGSGVIIVEEYP